MNSKTLSTLSVLLLATGCGDDGTALPTTTVPMTSDGSATDASTSIGSISESITDTFTTSGTGGGSGSSMGDETLDGTTTTGPDMACGDGVLDEGEACDDANVDDGDGCSSGCEIEEGFECMGDEPSTCATVCGDGLVVGDEACDDGNTNDGDGCLSTCELQPGFGCMGEPSVCDTVCGDGMVFGMEGCDDGNAEDDDGCSSTCQTENGYVCLGLPSVCNSICGDGIVASDEGCDDGNIAIGDGCTSMCDPEPGYDCPGEPSVCAAVCGDGLVLGDEECDDMNLMVGDGCSDLCTVEEGFGCQGEPSMCIPCGPGSALDGLQITELFIGNSDYVDLTNTGMCDLDLTGLNIFFDDSSLTDLDYAFPPMTMILAGQTLRIFEPGGVGDLDTGGNITFSSVRGGATMLCTGVCASDVDVLDAVAFSEGAPHPPLPPGVTFAPAGLTGIDQNTQSYVRTDSVGVSPDFLASDWSILP